MALIYNSWWFVVYVRDVQNLPNWKPIISDHYFEVISSAMSKPSYNGENNYKANYNKLYTPTPLKNASQNQKNSMHWQH